MRRCLQVVFVTLVVATTGSGFPSARPEVLKIVVDMPIHSITEEYISRALDSAQSNHDEAVLIELYTPGGLVTSTRAIISRIVSSPVPVIVYVTPTGSTAASAGFYILESADVAAMAPGTNTGSAHPVSAFGKMDDVMKEKVENDLAAFMRSFVSKRGRNVDLAESGVRQSKSFTDQEALSQHLIDYVAPSEDDLFKQLDGKTIKRFDGSQTALHLGSPVVRMYNMTLKEHILSPLLDPNVALILLNIGIFALLIEFNSPGAIIPGVIGFIAILLSIFAFNLLPTSYAGLAMILAAFILFALEAKFQSHGVLTVGGIALLIVGSLTLVDGPIPEMRVKLATALAISIPFGIITTILMTAAIKARRNKVQTGVQELVGSAAIACTPLTPEGKVFVMGELWNAVSRVPAEAGSHLRVRAVKGLRLEVEPEEAKDGPPQ